LYTVDNQSLSTRAISEDKNVLCEVVAPKMGFKAGEYPVYDTSKLRSLLGVVGEALAVTTKQSNDKFTGLEFTDGNTEVTFVLADAAVIPSVPALNKLPPFELVIELDDKFIMTFVKAKSALSDVDTFTIMSHETSSDVEVVLGHSSLNTNRVKITTPAREVASMQPISFSAKYLREIFVTNKDAKNGTMEVSSKGLTRVSFEADGIVSTYYLSRITT
jgi:hypothetical protein